MIRVARTALAILLGCFWAYSGAEKLLLIARGEILPPYLLQFGTLTILAVSIAECVAALHFFANRVRTSSLMGMLLLSAFTVVLIVRPPHVGGCGSFGLSNVAPWLDQVPPVGRNALLLAIHALLDSMSSAKPPRS